MQALFDGSVAIEGVDLKPVQIGLPTAVFSRMLVDDAFDIAEMSLTHSFVYTAQHRARFTTLPVFPSRMFRHGSIFINRDAGIHSPADLAGKRIGVQGFQMTAAVWQRGMLTEDFGVSFAEVQWFEGGVNEPSTIGTDATSMHPPGLRVRPMPAGATLSSMLADGDIDALIGAIIPKSLTTSDRVVRLFSDTHATERSYYERTGIFPIMHALVVRTPLVEEHPWLANAIVDACTAAKQKAISEMHFSGALKYMLPWLQESLDEIAAVFKSDPWTYGVDANRRPLDAFNRFLVKDGFLSETLPLEVLFPT